MPFCFALHQGRLRFFFRFFFCGISSRSDWRCFTRYHLVFFSNIVLPVSKGVRKSFSGYAPYLTLFVSICSMLL